MKYLILILTLLFSFNVKAETWNCAIDSEPLTFVRENDIFLGNGEFEFNYSENLPNIALHRSVILNEIVSFQSFVINVTTFEITMANLRRLDASENPSLEVKIGNCRMIE